MKRDWAKHIFYLLIAVILVGWIVAGETVWADGDCKGQSCNQGGGDVTVGGDTIEVTGGDVSVPVSLSGGDQTVEGDKFKSKALGLAISNFGDVAIGNCIISKQTAWGPIRATQRYEYDYWCIARELDIAGRHGAAAILRCNKVEDLRDIFGESCEETFTFRPVVAAVAAVADVADSDEDLEEEWHEEQQMLVADIQAKIENLKKEIEATRLKPAAAPKVIHERIVEQKEFLSPEKKEYIRSLRIEK